ncbi:MAG: hypothetical protein V1898_02180 [Patescibacteria group bacterium]
MLKRHYLKKNVEVQGNLEVDGALSGSAFAALQDVITTDNVSSLDTASLTGGEIYYNTADNKLYVYNSSAFVDLTQQDTDTDTNTTYTAGDNITISNGQISATDTNTTYSAGTGISINGSGVISSTIIDTNTTYTAGTGLSLAGTVFSSSLGTSITSSEITDGTIDTADIKSGAVTSDKIANGTITTSDMASNSCGSNQILKYTGSAWACAADTDTNTTYTAGTGLSLAGTVFSSSLGTSITSSEITDGTITLDDIGTNAVDADELSSSAIQSGDIEVGDLPTSGSWTLSGDLNIDANALYMDHDYYNIGIGTDNPTMPLTVVGNVTDPELMSEVYQDDGEFSRMLAASFVYVSGNYAYVTSLVGLTIMDISNPTDPVLMSEVYDGDGEFSKLQWADSVYVSGNYAYVTSLWDNSLTIMDISDPIDPVLMSEVYDGDGEFSKLNAANSVFVSGDYAYITSLTGDSLTIMDISDPIDPVLMSEVYDGDGEFSKLNEVNFVYVSGNYAYITADEDDIDNDGSLTIMDISDPTDPVLMSEVYNGDGEFSKLYGANSVYVAGNYAYITADGDEETDVGSLTIMDISNPTDPVLMSEIYDENGEFTKLYGANSVYVAGNYAYVLGLTESAMTIMSVGGASINNMEVGSIKAGGLQVMDNLSVFNDVNIRGGFESGNALINGDLSVNGDISMDDADIMGIMRLTPKEVMEGRCNGGSTGSVYFDTSDNEPCYCDGVHWVQFDGGGFCSPILI